jgi:AcrR family transcriptional regulator
MPSPTRTRILATSSRLYLRGGDHSLSMRRVANQIGVSATAIYRHFPGRAELIEAVVEQAFAEFERFLSATPPTPPGREQLRRFVRQYFDFAVKKPRLFEVLFLRKRANLRRYPDDFANRQSRTFELLHDTVCAAVQAGALRRDIDTREIALTVWTHAHGFAAQYWVGRFGPDSTRIRRMYDRYMDLLLEGLAR